MPAVGSTPVNEAIRLDLNFAEAKGNGGHRARADFDEAIRSHVGKDSVKNICGRSQRFQNQNSAVKLELTAFGTHRFFSYRSGLGGCARFSLG